MNHAKHKIKTIFMGTPDFAIPSLESLVNDDRFEVALVITQKDKPIGRDQEILPPPIKKLAQKKNIPVLQPDKLASIINDITNISPDIIVVAAYGKIIPQSIIEIPRFGCVNVHGSLLPKHRGASCIQGAIKDGDTETGATIMLIDAGLDTGPIISQENIPITEEDTSSTLSMKVALLGASILNESIIAFISGNIRPMKQDDDQSTYDKMLAKEDGKINWQDHATSIERHARAMTPWPMAWSTLGGIKIIFHKTKVSIIDPDGQPGKMMFMDDSIIIKCGEGSLKIDKLQLPGKIPVSATDFMRGHGKLDGSFLE